MYRLTFAGNTGLIVGFVVGWFSWNYFQNLDKDKYLESFPLKVELKVELGAAYMIRGPFLQGKLSFKGVIWAAYMIRGQFFYKESNSCVILFSFLHTFRSNTFLYEQTPLKKGTLFVCVEILLPSQPNGIMTLAVSLPNHTLSS